MAPPGDHTLSCRDGAWSRPWPQCRPTFQHFNGGTQRLYTLSITWILSIAELAPPRVEHSVLGGSWLVGRVGQLLVTPGSIGELSLAET